MIKQNHDKTLPQDTYINSNNAMQYKSTSKQKLQESELAQKSSNFFEACKAMFAFVRKKQ